MSDCMTFPDDWREFLRDYSFKDTDEVYTNGAELIPVFRVEQLIEHLLKAQEPRVLTMTNQRAIILLSQMYLPSFDDEEKDALTKAIEALTEQEPRVLTLEEVKKLQSIRDGAIWLELYCNALFPTLPEFSNKSLTFFVAIPFTGYRSTWENDWYGKTWRCWSSRPTQEQREAVPWNT